MGRRAFARVALGVAAILAAGLATPLLDRGDLPQALLLALAVLALPAAGRMRDTGRSPLWLLPPALPIAGAALLTWWALGAVDPYVDPAAATPDPAGPLPAWANPAVSGAVWGAGALLTGCAVLLTLFLSRPSEPAR